MTRHPNTPRPTSSGPLAPWVSMWTLSLTAQGKSERTVFTYTDAALLFGGWLELHHPDVEDLDQLTRHHLRAFFTWLQVGGEPCPHDLTSATEAPCKGYGKGYVSQLARALQQLTKFWADEEDAPDPMGRVKLPAPHKLGEKVPNVIELEQLEAIVKAVEKDKTAVGRRDAALIRLYACTGCRLSELALVSVGHVNVDKRQILVTGKGNRQRTVRYDHKAAMALSRYLRLRAKQPNAATSDALWLGLRGPMTPNGVRQAIERRAANVGLKVHPHMFRHTFAHRWRANGGGEDDLMELAGWDSPQMLKHYGRSAAGERARSAYDGVKLMGGI